MRIRSRALSRASTSAAAADRRHKDRTGRGSSGSALTISPLQRSMASTNSRPLGRRA